MGTGPFSFSYFIEHWILIPFSLFLSLQSCTHILVSVVTFSFLISNVYQEFLRFVFFCVWGNRLSLMKCIMLMMLKEALFGKKLLSCFQDILTLSSFQQRYMLSVSIFCLAYYFLSGEHVICIFIQFSVSSYCKIIKYKFYFYIFIYSFVFNFGEVCIWRNLHQRNNKIRRRMNYYSTYWLKKLRCKIAIMSSLARKWSRDHKGHW